MRLNHLNLTVTDVLVARDFLERYFGLRNIGGNAGMAFLSDDDGFVLTLMKAGKATKLPIPATSTLASLWRATRLWTRSIAA